MVGIGYNLLHRYWRHLLNFTVCCNQMHLHRVYLRPLAVIVPFFVCVKDEPNQVLIAYLWIRQTWHDAYLRWNTEDYDGLDVIHIPSSLVWRPDLVLYNKYASTSKTCSHRE